MRGAWCVVLSAWCILSCAASGFGQDLIPFADKGVYDFDVLWQGMDIEIISPDGDLVCSGKLVEDARGYLLLTNAKKHYLWPKRPIKYVEIVKEENKMRIYEDQAYQLKLWDK